MPDISIVVFANRNDFFLTKLCITSIRYYYPEIKILLVKDKLNGDFKTSRLRKFYNVELLNLGKNYYGWGSAKIFFLLNEELPRKRYLCLDSDIIFVGNVLTKFQNTTGDFVFNPHYLSAPFHKEALDIYLYPQTAKDIYSDYEYPGYFFNSGQMLVTPGLITKRLLNKTFQTNKYPYYIINFRCPDQTILNMIMPVLKKRKNIEINDLTYMILSPQFFADSTNNSFEKFKDGKTELIVHYAGDIRNNNLDKMRGNNLLKGFREVYLSKLSQFDKIADIVQDKINANKNINRILYFRNRLWMKFLDRIKR